MRIHQHLFVKLTMPLSLMSALGACHRDVCRGASLAQAATPEQERVALVEFWQKCRPLSVSAHDKRGRSVSFSKPNWTRQAHRITLDGGHGPFQHILIAPDNALLLLRE